MEKGKNISDDFLDIEFFQILQNRFAEEFGIASVITDINGLPLTEPSNFTEFCSIHTRGTTIGFKKCMLCDAYGGNQKDKSFKKACCLSLPCRAYRFCKSNYHWR